MTFLALARALQASPSVRPLELTGGGQEDAAGNLVGRAKCDTRGATVCPRGQVRVHAARAGPRGKLQLTICKLH